MALPQRVQDQLAAAEAALNQANGTPPAGASPEVDLAALAAAPTPEPAKVEPPVPTEPPAPAKPLDAAPEETWESRFRSLQGLFNQQVPLLQNQVKDLTAKYQSAIDAVEKLQVTQQNKPTPPAQPALDPKDAENFGEDLVQMVLRVANASLAGVAQKVDSVVASFESRLVELEKGVKGATQTAAISAEQSFFDRLTKGVPDWEAVNADARFLAWLQEVDPVYGQPRQAALNVAQQNLDVARAVAVFNAFKATLPAPAAPKNDALDRQVTPRSTASNPPPSQDKPILSQRQVADFYDSLRKGAFTGRQQEARNIENAINLAIAEGRVR